MSDFKWDEEKPTWTDNSTKPTYTSKYQSTIDSLLNKIATREEFSYDFNADPLYQQYKDQYTKLGNEASMNAAANVSALTGGYGNSYAATAATQANQQYLTELNNMIPELYNAALNKYQMESEDLYNQYSAFGDAEDREYGKYRDTVSDYYTDRDFSYNQYRDAVSDYYTERDFSYNQYRDDVSDSQWQKTFDYNKSVDDRNYNYQLSRDAVSDDQWNKTFEYNQQQDQTSNDQWNKEFNYQQERDKVADEQWEKEFGLSQYKAYNSGSSSSSSGKDDDEGYSTNNAASDLLYGNYASLTRRFTNEQGEDYSKDYIYKLYSNGKISEEQYYKLRDLIQ